MDTCQTQNNACFSQVLGGPGPNAQTVREEPAKPDNAVAGKSEGRAAKVAAPAKPAVKTAKPAERKPQ